MNRWYKLRTETVVGLGGLALAWQAASYFFPPYLFPPIPEIVQKFFAIFIDQESLANAGATAARRRGTVRRISSPPKDILLGFFRGDA